MRPFFLLLLLLPACLSAQTLWQAGVRLQGMMGAGWWTWDRGLDEQGWHQGHDRTHLALLGSGEAEVLLARGRWQLSLGGSLQQLRDDEMVGTNHARGNYQRYQVVPEGKSTLALQSLALGLGYELIKRPRYAFMPQVRLGTFTWQQAHPEQAQMGLRLVRELRLINRFWLGDHVALLLWPQLSNWYVGPNALAAPQERHRILHIDLGLGLEVTLKPAP